MALPRRRRANGPEKRPEKRSQGGASARESVLDCLGRLNQASTCAWLAQVAQKRQIRARSHAPSLLCASFGCGALGMGLRLDACAFRGGKVGKLAQGRTQTSRSVLAEVLVKVLAKIGASLRDWSEALRQGHTGRAPQAVSVRETSRLSCRKGRHSRLGTTFASTAALPLWAPHSL